MFPTKQLDEENREEADGEEEMRYGRMPSGRPNRNFQPDPLAGN